MATKQDKNRNRYRSMRSAILTGSVLSILPVLALIRGGATNASTSAPMATSGEGIAVSVNSAQTASSQSTTNQIARSTSLSAKAPATTHTRTRAS